jgi:hypothetical protein
MGTTRRADMSVASSSKRGDGKSAPTVWDVSNWFMFVGRDERSGGTFSGLDAPVTALVDAQD